MQTMTCTRRQMVRHDLAIPLIRIHKNRQINAVTLAKCVQHLNSFKLKIYKM